MLNRIKITPFQYPTEYGVRVATVQKVTLRIYLNTVIWYWK